METIESNQWPVYYEYITVYLFTIIRGSSWYSIIIILKMLHNILLYIFAQPWSLTLQSCWRDKYPSKQVTFNCTGIIKREPYMIHYV